LSFSLSSSSFVSFVVNISFKSAFQSDIGLDYTMYLEY
jgi:hypothetical protein